jgi:hypothetical protein
MWMYGRRCNANLNQLRSQGNIFEDFGLFLSILLIFLPEQPDISVFWALQFAWGKSGTSTLLGLPLSPVIYKTAQKLLLAVAAVGIPDPIPTINGGPPISRRIEGRALYSSGRTGRLPPKELLKIC